MSLVGRVGRVGLMVGAVGCPKKKNQPSGVWVNVASRLARRAIHQTYSRPTRLTLTDRPCGPTCLLADPPSLRHPDQPCSTGPESPPCG